MRILIEKVVKKENLMKFIKGVTFAPFSKKGMFRGDQVRESFDRMIKGTGADFVIFVPNGLQDTPQSETISYVNDDNVKN